MNLIAQAVRVFAVLAGSHASDHPVRTCLTVIGVSLGVGAPVAIDLANRDVLRSFQQAVADVAGAATLEVAGGELGLNEDVIRVVRSHSHIVAALPIIMQSMRDVVSGETVTVFGTDLLEVAEAKQLRWRDTESRTVTPLLDEGVLVGRRVAERWGIQSGAVRTFEIGVGTREIRIGGVMDSGEGSGSVWETVAIMDIAPAQEMFGRLGRLDRIDVVTERNAAVMEVQQSLQAQMPYGVSVRRPVQRGEQVESMVSAFRLNLLMLSTVGLLVGGFLIYNTLSFSVVQRRREIGILRAIGLSERGIYGLFLSEGLVWGAMGGMLGGLLGIALSQSLVGMIGRNISELYVPMEGLWHQRPVPSRLTPVLVQGMALGIVLSLLGALTPSLEASRTNVVGALAPGGYELTRRRHVGRWWWGGLVLLLASVAFACVLPTGNLPLFGYLSVLSLLLGLTAMAPALVHRIGDVRVYWAHRCRRKVSVSLAGLAAQAAARAPHRNGVTISSLLVGLAIMVGVVIMIRSFRQTVETWIDQTVVADLIVTPVGWLRAEQEGQADRLFSRWWADRIEQVPGVAAVDTYRSFKIEVGGRLRTVVARDLLLHADRSRYLFIDHGDSKLLLRRAAAEKGVVVSEVLAGALGLSRGDDLFLTTPAGPRAFPVIGIFYDYATDGGKIVMDRSLFLEYWGDDSATVIPIYLEAGADVQGVSQRLADVFREREEARHFSVLPNAELRQEILAIFDRTFRVTYVLEVIAVVIAMFGIVNTLLTAALERRRELATLQALGASQGQVIGLLLWEAGYLGALGGGLGIAGGVWLAAVLVWVINKQSFGWTIPLTIPADVLGAAAVLSIGTALAAAYWPAHWIASRSAVEGLRYE